MTAVLTNRLIGTAILIVAAVVFLPDLLDGRKQVSKDDFKVIPERPEFAEVAQPAVFSQDQHQAAQTAAMAPPTDNTPALDLPAANDAIVTSEPAGSEISAQQSGAATDPEPTVRDAVAVTEPATATPPAHNQSANVEAASLAAAPLPRSRSTVPSRWTACASMICARSSGVSRSRSDPCWTARAVLPLFTPATIVGVSVTLAPSTVIAVVSGAIGCCNNSAAPS